MPETGHHLCCAANSASLQGYLAHKKPPLPLRPPCEPRHGPAVGSYGVVVSDKRGTPVIPPPPHLRQTQDAISGTAAVPEITSLSDSHPLAHLHGQACLTHSLSHTHSHTRTHTQTHTHTPQLRQTQTPKTINSKGLEAAFKASPNRFGFLVD